jgi:hypothetical protein
MVEQGATEKQGQCEAGKSGANNFTNHGCRVSQIHRIEKVNLNICSNICSDGKPQSDHEYGQISDYKQAPWVYLFRHFPVIPLVAMYW